MSGPNPREMAPRELCAGLMRGSRTDQRLGYSASNAAFAAADLKGVSNEEVPELVAWSEGFADGIAGAIESADTSSKFGRYGEPSDPRLRQCYLEGLTTGSTEDGMKLYPDLPDPGVAAA